ncbi:hypothetical protein [Rhizorhabdus wittichii]|jgi:hypothetical protein
MNDEEKGDPGFRQDDGEDRAECRSSPGYCLRAISRQMETSADSEIAVKQQSRAADPMQSDREPL